MALSLVLDNVTLPDKGAVELQINRSFQLTISAKEARRKVHGWLIDHVSMMIGADEPTLTLVDDAIVWRIPAIYTAPQVGVVGVAGTVDVNVESGVVDTSKECKNNILDGARELAKTLPPFELRHVPEEYLAKNYTPTVANPQGDPREIIASI